MKNPTAQVYKDVSFQKKIDVPTILGYGGPSFRKQKKRERATSIVERVPTHPKVGVSVTIEGARHTHHMFVQVESGVSPWGDIQQAPQKS